MEITARERRWNAALRTADDVVAFAEGREPIIAVGRDFRHRERAGPFFLERRDLCRQLLLAGELNRRQRLVDLRARNTDRFVDLNGEQLLAGSPFRFRFCCRPVNRLGEVLLDLLELQPIAMRLLDGGDLLSQLIAPGVDRIVLCEIGRRFRRRRQRHFGFHVPEDRRFERVVVPLPDRVELVIVAARAVDRQPQRALANRAENLVQIIEAALGVVLFPEQHPGTGPQKTGGNQAVLGPAIHLVAGDLFGQEDVIGLVGVERADHVVAIAPGVGPMHVVLEARRIRIPRHVEPVPPVPFAVVRRGEQLVDQPLPGARLVVRDEGGDFRGRRRQAEQIEIRTTDEGQPIGAGSRGQLVLRPRLFQESIDRVREILAVDLRNRSLLGKPERPVGAFLRRERSMFDGRERRSAGRGRSVHRPIPPGTLVDPLFQQGQLRPVERRPLHRHRRLFESRDHPVQTAALSVPRHEHRTARATGQRRLARAEIELRKLQRSAMARYALPFQDRSDVAVEGDGWLRSRLRREVRSAQEKGDADDPEGPRSSSWHARSPVSFRCDDTRRAQGRAASFLLDCRNEKTGTEVGRARALLGTVLDIAERAAARRFVEHAAVSANRMKSMAGISTSGRSNGTTWTPMPRMIFRASRMSNGDELSGGFPALARECGSEVAAAQPPGRQPRHPIEKARREAVVLAVGP